MARRTAVSMAMLGFALACVLGAVTGCSLETALSRALLAAGALFLVGLGVGWAGEMLLREHFQALAKEEGEQDETRPSPGSAGEGTAED